MVARAAGGVCRVLGTRAADGTRLILKGALDARAIPTLRPLLASVVASEPNLVVLDLAKLKLMDAAGLRTLLALVELARSRGAQARVVRAHGQPLAMLRLLRLDAEVAPTPLEPDAVAPA
jgi:anti-anti-sigma factor